MHTSIRVAHCSSAAVQASGNHGGRVSVPREYRVSTPASQTTWQETRAAPVLERGEASAAPHVLTAKAAMEV